MSSIGAAIGYGFTSAATLATLCKNKEKNLGLKINAVVGALFSLAFVFLLLSPSGWGYGGLSTPARIALGVWCLLGIIFYIIARAKKKV